MKKKNIITSVILTIVSIIYTILVNNVDVKPVGPNYSEVGFAILNSHIHELLGYNKIIYKISELFGLLLLLLVVIYALIGIHQLMKRKNLLKVDKEILVLGGFYLLVFILYIVFDKVAINYRPVLMDGVLEPSYPSSHTMLALCVGISSLIVSKKYFNKKYIKQINIVTIVLMAVVLLGRLISGVHWFTDIIGGVIISLTLLSYFKLFYEHFCNKNQ